MICVKKRIKGSKISRKSDKQLEREAVLEENASIVGVIVVVILCLIVGISLGICLYKLALNSSAMIVTSLF